ncbi:DUF2092 domain-containing protein [Streptomyces sp. JJ66]|uniref:LolA family protein n=1 Tax=Streptomyces sp. JJ66 TaxID=2803843 RepID=UPI001C597FA9|nr:DUF2092 domain-containing protein [Streptomyces sp. JJ66]MBW1602564.1 DUF2092 domain-containing protein [Streptomyces sp. JJ66]
MAKPSGSRGPGKKTIRYAVPVAVAAVTVASVGLVPALADNGDPKLPDITAEELVAKLAASDVRQLSGTVEISSDLGIPGLGGGAGADGGPFGGGHGGPDGERGEEAPHDGAPEESPADPSGKLLELAGGEHTLRVAMDGPDKQRVSVIEEAAEYSLIHNAGELWAYDSASNTAFHAQAPEGHRGGEKPTAPGPQDLTPQEAAERLLDAVDESTSVRVDGTTTVAGRDAYQLAVAPKDAAHSTVEAVRVAVDAENGTPLRFSLDARDGGDPIVEAAYTEVDFGKPSADLFDFKPPAGTEVTEAGELDGGHGGPLNGDPGNLPGLDALAELGGETEVIGEGWSSVVKIDAPEGVMPENGELTGPQDGGFLDALTKEVKGEFGTGRMLSTRLVNALLTDDGTLYVGAVTEEGLVQAADAD